MKKIIGIIFLLVTVFTFANEIKAPDFKLKDQYGVEHSLEKYRGKVVILNFWATWCSVCKSELKDIEELYQEYGKNEKDVIFLGVNDENLQKVTEYLTENDYNFPTVIDKKLMEKYQIRAFPTIFIIDKVGNIHKYAIGAIPPHILKSVIDIAKNSN